MNKPIGECSVAVRAEFDVYTRKTVLNRKGRVVHRGALQHRVAGKNLITNTGMDRLGNDTIPNFGAFLQVGTSNTAPANTDTALGARVAGQAAAGYTSGSWSWDTTNPKVAVLTRTYTFGAGVAAGVLTELGLSVTTNGTLSTRALFTDEGGSPITVTVLADEQLIVTYRMFFEASETDSTLSTTQKGTDFALVLRPARLGAAFADSQFIGRATDRLSALVAGAGITGTTMANSYRGGTSAIGTVTGVPTGTSGAHIFASLTRTFGTYTNGNHYRDDTLGFPLTEANLADMGAFLIQGIPFHVQIGVTPRVTKTSSDLMSFTVRTSWSRG